MSTLISRIFASLLVAFALVACAGEPAAPTVPSEAEDVPLFTQAELDQMLAPVALYPDELLSQLLMAATYPLEVVEAARFSRANPDLKGQDAVRAAQDKPWDPSVKAMLAFPQILDRMDQDLDWTRRLGDAFLAQQEQVMDTVQTLRVRADEAGNLQETEHVQVVREERTIIVRNRYPDMVYVPYYDPLLIYGSWWWPDYEPVRWSPWGGYRYYSGYSGYFWGPPVVVGHGFFFGHYDWRYRYIRVVEAPPFYYRRPPPPRYRWEHDYRHRKGVPYRHQRVYERYHDDRDPVPGRPPRDRRDDPQDHHADVQPPVPDPREGGERPPREGGQGPRGEAPDRDRGVNTGGSTPVAQPPAVGTDRRMPKERPEVDAGSVPATPSVPHTRDPDPRDGRKERRAAPEDSAPTQETPRYTPPPVREVPAYAAPPRQPPPSHTPAPKRETPSYTPAPQREKPSYSPPPQRAASGSSAPSRSGSSSTSQRSGQGNESRNRERPN